jgi:uncharacterized protein (DUF927 family)
MRMNRDTSSRPVATWRTLYLSSGEISLATKIQEDGRHKVKEGQQVRTLDIPAKASDELGLFEDLHGASGGREFADGIKNAAAKYYGTPIRAFLTYLAKNVNEVTAGLSLTKADFLAKHVPEGADGQVERAANRFALVAAAGELAAACGVLPWEPGEAINGATACFNAWLDQRAAGIGAGEIAAATAQIQKFFEAHGESRFTEWRADTPKGNFLDDDLDSHEPRPTINRAGVKRKTPQGLTEFFVFPETFKTELCAGFDAKSVAQELVKRNLLVPGEKNKTAPKVRLPGIGQARVYHFNPEILANTEGK